MNVTEASHINTLCAALGISSWQGHEATPKTRDEVVTALSVLADQAHKRLGAGVTQYQVDTWALEGSIVPTTALIRALLDFKDTDVEAWTDSATGFTCTEADTLHDLMEAVGEHETAAQFIVAHAAGDEPTDRHYGYEEAS